MTDTISGRWALWALTFIYGEARQSDVQKGLTGNELFPMGRIVIEDEQGQVVREFDYESPGQICDRYLH